MGKCIVLLFLPAFSGNPDCSFGPFDTPQKALDFINKRRGEWNRAYGEIHTNNRQKDFGAWSFSIVEHFDS